MKQVQRIGAEVVQNMLKGIAIGDAFGAGVEFQDRNWIRENVDFTRFVDARSSIRVAPDQLAAFVQNYHPWDYTDDTEMTIAIMRAIAAPELFTEDLVVRELHAEYDRGLREKGHGRNGHGSLRWYFEGMKTISEVRDFQRDRPNPGNAPAVRAVPIGLMPPPMINDYAAINANATHPNPMAIFASQCIAWASEFMIVQKGNPRLVIAYCKAHAWSNAAAEEYLSQVDQLPNYQELDGDGLRVLCGPQPIVEPYFLPGIAGVPSDSRFTVGAILYVLKHCEDAFDALKKSIFLGGDVDSIAAVTVGIMAARGGLGLIPRFIVTHVEGMEYLEEVATMFHAYMNLS
jgi:ADP-ribosylglycohydrolase